MLPVLQPVNKVMAMEQAIAPAVRILVFVFMLIRAFVSMAISD
jgi:hypothetical protein